MLGGVKFIGAHEVGSGELVMEWRRTSTQGELRLIRPAEELREAAPELLETALAAGERHWVPAHLVPMLTKLKEAYNQKGEAE